MSFRSFVNGLLADSETDGHGDHPAIAGLILTVITLTVAGAMFGTLSGPPLLEESIIRIGYPLATCVFLLEFMARFWSAAESAPHSDRATPIGQTRITPSATTSARLAYLFSFLGFVDLLTPLPMVAAVVLPGANDWLLVAAILSLLKLGRYISGLALVGRVVRREGHALLAAVAAMAVVLLIVSTIMYWLERTTQPQVFSSVPHALWWGIVTMATIGYGDMVPITPLGKIFGGFVMLLGIAMFAVPAGILATGFASELRRREFVVTWRSVARVPLFAQLDASQISSVASLLKPQIVPQDSVIVRRGDSAQAMFFLMEGEVEVDVPPRPVRLKAGDFFGEIALLRDMRRTATVTAVTECRLLALDVADFRRLVEQYPELHEEMRRTADERQGV